MLEVLNKKRDREKNLKYEVVFDVITKECLIDGLHRWADYNKTVSYISQVCVYRQGQLEGQLIRREEVILTCTGGGHTDCKSGFSGLILVSCLVDIKFNDKDPANVDRSVIRHISLNVINVTARAFHYI